MKFKESQIRSEILKTNILLKSVLRLHGKKKEKSLVILKLFLTSKPSLLDCVTEAGISSSDLASMSREVRKNSILKIFRRAFSSHLDNIRYCAAKILLENESKGFSAGVSELERVGDPYQLFLSVQKSYEKNDQSEIDFLEKSFIQEVEWDEKLKKEYPRYREVFGPFSDPEDLEVFISKRVEIYNEILELDEL